MQTMNEREQKLLITLVERYIADGQPVGSKTLALTEQYSPATIRNVMAELENKGFLSSPHTSAGRVPTESGYRYFVNTVLHTEKSQSMNQAAALTDYMNTIQSSLKQDLPPEKLLERISSSLSNITQLAGLVTLPLQQNQILEHIEFLALSDKRLLTVIVLKNQQVQNRVFEVTQTYTESQLQAASNFINHHYSGEPLDKIQALLEGDINLSRAEAREQMDLLVNEANQILQTDDATQVPGRDFVISGETNLMNVTTPEQIDNLKHLFEAFRQKSDFYHLFESCMGSDGVQIFIGRESGHSVLSDYAMVTAPYKANDEIVGLLGVIGPTRMPYKQAITAVDITSKLFGAVLNSK